MKYCVIGDVGGHVDEFEALLTQAGCDPILGVIPPDVTVIQLGDLVHRGPDSPAVVGLVETFLTGLDAERWVQLIGNHEAQYLRPGEPTFAWDEVIPEATIATLKAWWENGQIQVAANAGGVLVTHAGLTAGFWRYLGSPSSAALAAKALNGLPRQRVSPLWTPGTMLSGPPVMDAGPVWASSTAELIPSWIAHQAPFNQVVGHTATRTPQGQWRTDTPDVAATLTWLPDDQMAMAEVGGRQIWCIDPDHGATPTPGWNAVLVESGRVKPWPR